MLDCYPTYLALFRSVQRVLGLPSVIGYVTHADLSWIAACRRHYRVGPIDAVAAALKEIGSVWNPPADR